MNMIGHDDPGAQFVTLAVEILKRIGNQFGNGWLAQETLAVAVGEEPDTLEEVYEPYLIMEGYLKRTAQGRVATELSYKKLGLKPSRANQSSLL